MLKLIAYGRSYFDNAWNRFDFTVVVVSTAFMVGSEALSAISFLPQLARIMRVLRITRLLKMQKGLQAIIQTIMFSVPSLANVFMLLMLVFFIFSVLGESLFKNVKQGEVIDDYKNFGNFFNAFLLLWALTTGEDWNLVMIDCWAGPDDGCVPGVNCGAPSAAIPYFLVLILVCTHVMLNLFILVIIEQFEKYYLPADNTILKFKNDLEAFMKVWKNETMVNYRCRKIQEKNLARFFRALGEDGDLGFNKEKVNEDELKKHMLKMAIKGDLGYIYFNELLYRCMRRKYSPPKLKKKLMVNEVYTQYQVLQMTWKVKGINKMKMTNDDIYNSLIKKENQINPFLMNMNYKITFKTWKKEAKMRIK